MPPCLATVRRCGRSLAFLLLSLLAMSSVAADPAGRVGRIAWLFGSVYHHRAESGESSAALLNWPLTSGDALSSGAGGRAEVQIGSTLLQLDAGTVLEFVQLDDRRLALHLRDGSVIARFLSSEAAREFELTTRAGRFEVRAAGRYRFDVDRSSVAATAYSGGVRFVAAEADTPLLISSGQSARIWSNGRTQYQMSAPVDDDFAAWSSGRDRQYGSASPPRYVSPEMTGATDLDAHGDWYETPDYGAVWFPRAVAADWAPYRAGRWAWVEPWGWTWVGDESWGFAPFHYGRWAYFRGAWGWVPGSRLARPVYAPALVAWVGGSSAAGSAPGGARPAVGWFPLAPREVYIPGYRSSPKYLREVNSPHVTHITNLTEITMNPEAVAARTRYANHHLPQAVTAMPDEAMGQRRPVREVAIGPADRAVFSSQPVQVRAPVARLGREDDRRRATQMPSPDERSQRPAGGPPTEGQPGRRGDARQAPPPAALASPAAAGLSTPPPALAPSPRPTGVVPPPAPTQVPTPVRPSAPISPPTVATPAPRPVPPAEAAFPPGARDALPHQPVAQPRPEAASSGARRPDPRPPLAVPASPMGPGASPVLPGERRGQGSLSTPAPERRERSADAGERPPAPPAFEGKDRRLEPSSQEPGRAPAMSAPGAERRPVAAPVPVPLPRTEAAGQHPAATPPPTVAAPQRLERPPVEAARPATVARPERTEPRQPERAPTAPSRVDTPVQRERPGGEHQPGGGRPNEKRGDPREEQRARLPGTQ